MISIVQRFHQSMLIALSLMKDAQTHGGVTFSMPCCWEGGGECNFNAAQTMDGMKMPIKNIVYMLDTVWIVDSIAKHRWITMFVFNFLSIILGKLTFSRYFLWKWSPHSSGNICASIHFKSPRCRSDSVKSTCKAAIHTTIDTNNI